jgi:aminopeptidase N
MIIPSSCWRFVLACFLAAGALFLLPAHLHADRPYAPSREYDLQHSRIALRFDVDQKKVIGEVTHTLTVFGDSVTKISFDAAGLNIQSVSINRSSAKFEMDAKNNKLIVDLPAPARAGTKLDVTIRYDAKPTNGLYFILPHNDYPYRAKQNSTQRESEDTHY